MISLLRLVFLQYGISDGSSGRVGGREGGLTSTSTNASAVADEGGRD